MIALLIISIVLQLIGIKLFMLSIVVHCYANDKHSCAIHLNLIAYDKHS